MAKTDNLIDFLSDIARTIKEKTGKPDPIDAQDFSDEIRSIGGGGGGSETLDALISNDKIADVNIQTSVSSIRPYAFYRANNLTDFSGSDVTTIGQYAFFSTKLSRINIEKCSHIGDRAFGDCYNLTEIKTSSTVVFDGMSAFLQCSKLEKINNYTLNVASIPSATFAGCAALSSISLPICTDIGVLAFQNCKKLTNISIPECRSIWGNAFVGCTELSSINAPKVSYIDTSAFANLTKLVSISLPTCQVIFNYAFTGDTLLGSNLYLPVCSSIGAYAFANCTSLKSVTIGNGSLNSMYLNTNSFQNCDLDSLKLNGTVVCRLPTGATVFGNGKVTNLYVPSALYNAYSTSGSWALFISKYVTNFLSF